MTRLYVPQNTHAGIFERTRPVTIRYFDNRLSVVKGRSNLKFFKLKPGSGVVNMATTCCNTFMLKENVRYEGTVVAAIDQDYGNDDNADLPLEDHQPRPVQHRHNLANVEPQDPIIRTFPNDWLPEHVSFLKPMPSIWFDDGGNVVGQPNEWEATFDTYMERIMAKVPPMMAGIEFGVLMSEDDHEVEVVEEKIFTDANAVGQDTKVAIAQ